MKKFSRVNAEISLDALDHNMEVMHSRIKAGTRICAVVKANAYGHGAVEIAAHLEEKDYIWGYAVATAEEALQLRKAGIRKPVMLLGYVFPESYEDLILSDVRPCVFEMDSARKLSDTASALKRKVRVHIALDTGMSRIGFQPDADALDTVTEIAQLPNLEIEGLFTHFARADEKDTAQLEKQFAIYRTFSEKLSDRGVRIPVHHVSNSAALMRFPDANLDMVRAGITMYGLTPSDEIADEMTVLRSLMTLRSHISYVKVLPKGAAVSYGGTYVTSKDRTVVATIPVGYADGYPRTLSNRGTVLIHGTRCPIIGRVCMDQFMADVTDLSGVKTGDEAVLLGAQGHERITAEELGNLSGRFNYELVSDIQSRVPRTYIYHDKIISRREYLLGTE